MINITAVIQVSNMRESMSDRAFARLQGKPAIEFLLERVIAEFSNVCIVTSDDEKDDVFELISKKYNIQVARGRYENIIDRIALFLNDSGDVDFVRIFGNYPLVDLSLAKDVVEKHRNKEADYTFTEHINGAIWGTGFEVINASLIFELQKKKLTLEQQQNLSFYIRQNGKIYNIHRYIIKTDRTVGYKLFAETTKDYEVLNELVDNLPEITNEAILQYFKKHPVLAKYNHAEPAKEVGIDKILLHTEKIKDMMEGNKQSIYPVSVELTLTNACNLKCVYCSDNELRASQGHGSYIQKEVLFRLFDDLAKGGTKGITIEGGGEPTIYKDFDEVIGYALNTGLHVGLITNGVCRISEKVARKLEWIRVSLDASTAYEYKDIKGVDCFEHVLNNIAFYTNLCKTVGVGYVVTNKNLSQIEALVLRLRSMNVSYIQLRPVVDCPELFLKGEDLSYLNIYSSDRFGVIVDGMRENLSVGNLNLPCIANSLTSVISGDGSVYICGRLNIHKWLEPIGNVNDNTFYEIWYGEKRSKQMAMVCDANFCSDNCPQCRITKFNELIARVKQIKSKHFI